MNAIRISSLTIAGVTAMLSLAACGKGAENRPDTTTPAAAARVDTTTKPDTTAKADTANKMVEVGDVDVGRAIGSDKKITDKKDEFGRKDTIYVSVHTKNAGNAKLTARWNFEDGKVVEERTETITPAGDADTEFHIMKAAGLKPGKYTVHVMLDGKEVSSKDFTVKK